MASATQSIGVVMLYSSVPSVDFMLITDHNEYYSEMFCATKT